MKRKTREQNAITLVALIITIIVLLILAVVAIRAVTGDGIIAHAKNAQIGYEEEQAKEEGTLSYYASYLETQGNAGTWKQEGDNVTSIDSKITIKIGDKVAYNQGNGYTSNGFTTETTDSIGWRVLGVNEYGKIELISTNPTSELITFKGKDSYINAENILNNMCNELYGNGKGAESARSLNIDDVNKLAGITTEEKKEEMFSEEFNYGVKLYYKYIDGTIKVSTDGENYNFDTGVESYDFIDEEINQNNNGPKIIQISAYRYNIYENINREWRDGTNVGEFINNGENYTSTQFQWLASKVVKCHTDDYTKLSFSLFEISGNHNGISSCELYHPDGSESPGTMALRPVVTLNSNVNLTYDSTNDIWNIN